MAKKARPIKAAKTPTKKRVVKRKKVSAAIAPFRSIVFGDLHVNNETLERALQLLGIVKDKAKEYGADVVCVGDFWDLRGTLNVRQLDQVLYAVEEIKCPKWFVPGNHDQVSLDGMIHGMNVFRGYPDIKVATDRLFLVDGTVRAFLPWRERAEDQRAIFDLSDSERLWTMFAHGEAAGATANSGKRSSGLVTAKQINEHARACYLGHYHKRQQIGDRIWYIGSPYELDIGERDQPHGIALVTNEQTEPTWIDLDLFPRYWRLNYGDAWDLSEIKENDIVEVQGSPDEMEHPDFVKAIAEIPATVRTATKDLPAEKGTPSFALKLDDAIDAYVNQELESVAHPFDVMDLLALGRNILSEVPEAKAIPPLGPAVSIKEITMKDFCVLPGELTVPVSEMHRALITGPIGIGKTAIADASGWCFYGTTTPRKAGQAGATLRADDVINDYATECMVSCKVVVSGYKKIITVTRKRKRGKSSTVTIDGIEIKAGIADQQQLVQHVIGYPHELWRACVSLGQGAVANFATDADKRRKDLLSGAFDLGACPAAQKVAKKRLDVVKATLQDTQQQSIVATTQKETLGTQDFKEQIGQWQLVKRTELDAFTTAGNEAKAKITQCDELLVGEEKWLASKKQHDLRIQNVTKQLADLRPTAKIADLQRQYGALEAERAIVERDRNNAKTGLNALIEQSSTGVAVCSECGQVLPTESVEQHIQSHEANVRSKETELVSFQSRLSNISIELDALNTGGTEQKEQLEATIQESREALKKCDAALPQFTRIRTNKEEAERTLAKARTDYSAKAAMKNPFEEQAELNRKKIEELSAKIETLNLEATKLSAEKDSLSFWVEGFSPKGLPVLVLRTALYELETAANRYITKMLDGKVYCRLKMDGDDLQVQYFERDLHGNIHERMYEKLSGGQRRCVELAFAPFALSDLIFSRCGVRINLLAIDELTTHLGQAEKKRVCEILEAIDRENVIAIDHDLTVQGHFDSVYELVRTSEQATLELAS